MQTQTIRFAATLLAILLSAALAAPAVAARFEGMPSGHGSYEDLVKLYDEFLVYKDTAPARKEQPLQHVAGSPADVYPDYGPKAIEAQRGKLEEFQRRMEDMDVVNWPQNQQVDFLAVRSRLDQHRFLLDVSRPWSRDPGFYVDQMRPITFTELPVSGAKLRDLKTRLAAIAPLVEQAKHNLTEVAADYADLAIFHLTTDDGVGIGEGAPYRATPPPGLLGWYEDFLKRAEKAQPAVRRDIASARDAVKGYLDWLQRNRSKMTAQAGVGRKNFDWYLKYVELMPYDSHDIVILGERELNRLWATYALERQHNRNLPTLEIPTSREEYQRRIDDTEALLHKFLLKEEIITIPDYIGELHTNVPWIVRPEGQNYYEQMLYRDPMPDYVHAVIPGHSFDEAVERMNHHPIRGRLTSDSRVEGWGLYLEEATMHLGILDERPRTKELIYILGILRAARAPADVWLQLNQKTISDVMNYFIEKTPHMEKNVARYDAEVYLRTPGYGVAYSIGKLQMEQLLGDRKRQLGDAFVLKEFHDRFMQTGRLPISLIRWEMTGLDDEIRALWKREPLPDGR